MNADSAWKHLGRGLGQAKIEKTIQYCKVLRSLLTIAGISAVAMASAAPAHALTYIISGDYTLGGNTGTASGSFFWDGATLSNASIALTSVPATPGSIQTNSWTVAQALNFGTTSPFLIWNNPIEQGDGLRITLAPLPSTPIPNGTVNVTQLAYCGNTQGNNIGTFNTLGECTGDLTTSTQSSVVATAVPGSLSGFGLLALTPLVACRKRFLANFMA